MTLEELLQQNIPNRITQIENMYQQESLALIKIKEYLNEIETRDKKFLQIEESLIGRMSLIEEFIKKIAELSYKGGFYKPDKSKEQEKIASLKKEIEDKNKRIAEFENTLKQLMGKKD